MNEKKITSWLNLKFTKSLNWRDTIALVKKFGSPEDFPKKQQRLIGFLGAKVVEDIFTEKKRDIIEQTLEAFEKTEMDFITFCDKAYPKALKNLYNPPLFLFCRGQLDSAKLALSLGIVGTRKLSNYGRLITKKISYEIAKNGFSIVSGLAYGADTLAHKAALEAKSYTVAVLGTCVDNIYPTTNISIANKILDSSGAIVSENLPGTPPEPWVFPARNRIISGLSQGVLVTEGAVKSGALLTAKFALQQNKSIFAIPGDITREQSRGVNYLLKLGAKITTSAKDVLQEYGVVGKAFRKSQVELTKNEKKLYEIILENRPEVAFDKLLLESAYPFGKLSATLLSLEMKKLIVRLPANMIAVSF